MHIFRPGTPTRRHLDKSTENPKKRPESLEEKYVPGPDPSLPRLLPANDNMAEVSADTQHHN